MTPAHATTVVAVQRGGTVAVAGDGQVTVGDIVMKARASKVRRLFHGQVVCGFAGAVADALTLFDKFEQHLDKHQGNLVRAAIGLSKEWRTDKYLRRLEEFCRSGGGNLDLDTFANPDSWDAALLSAGAGLQAAIQRCAACASKKPSRPKSLKPVP